MNETEFYFELELVDTVYIMYYQRRLKVYYYKNNALFIKTNILLSIINQQSALPTFTIQRTIISHYVFTWNIFLYDRNKNSDKMDSDVG